MWSVLKMISAFHSCNDSKKQCYSACSLIWTNLVLPTIWCINQHTFKNNWLLVERHFFQSMFTFLSKWFSFLYHFAKEKVIQYFHTIKFHKLKTLILTNLFPFFCVKCIYELKKIVFVSNIPLLLFSDSIVRAILMLSCRANMGNSTIAILIGFIGLAILFVHNNKKSKKIRLQKVKKSRILAD